MEYDKAEKAAFILKTIAHPVRLRILELLDCNNRLSVSEICEKLNCEQSLTSHHLSNMKLKGILSSQREGKNIFYSLKEKAVLNIMSCLEDCECNMG
ncbi:metalloregulator ArsR/SmtB family transcription factor [Flammeovirga yaeyamensis]|uniref:Metalloregulator ArsR/SmtB family transcription factor n=1 Tax=Flammeovirga yaeyamensis TaxID=367791 RepID=A0AAX1N8W1_9BACT|nr:MULTISPECIES: metalloregulator ArsR/SmtB family transcription factor [Flammeovirga]ANQ50191.1 winged helix-turn-helix transcriptional regulator [Flammeovirga sp. MY04]MBB3701420.1 ArsR family transcriptional regulator [Flammeovirga yaeyamensis]NMF38548.1 winged helix-turn-helix transcriptional regulator [Flammeovirga yaeyamensis]QWG02373.1 metalloregulator ArsR/SmtB family transcription factor [Flammeovirga yaeyamensis]